MVNETDTAVAATPAEPQPTLPIPGTLALVPAALTLPAKVDTQGRVWPVAGITRMTRIPLAVLLEAGVQVEWALPDGTRIDHDTGVVLVAARQADMDKGYNPVFDVDTDVPPERAPDAKL